MLCKHEEKSCPRCNQAFECKLGDVAQCQCSGIFFSPEERKHIEEKYDDCLCRNCLLDLKTRYGFFTEKLFLKR